MIRRLAVMSECLGWLFLLFARFCMVDDRGKANLGYKQYEVFYEIRLDRIAPRNHF
jgi:hypothetical protein